MDTLCQCSSSLQQFPWQETTPRPLLNGCSPCSRPSSLRHVFFLALYFRVSSENQEKPGESHCCKGYDISRNKSPHSPSCLHRRGAPALGSTPLGWFQKGRVSRVTILLYPPQTGALAILQGRFEQNTRREASKVMQFHHSKTSPRSAHPPIPSFPVIVSLQDSVHTEPLTGCRKSRSHHSAEMKQEAWQGFSPAC